jgi:hypothetical protein
MNRKIFLILGLVICTASLSAFAQTNFPDKPIKAISAYAAGGGPDVQLRQVSPYLGEALKQTIIVENKVGAGGVLAEAAPKTCNEASGVGTRRASSATSATSSTCRPARSALTISATSAGFAVTLLSTTATLTSGNVHHSLTIDSDHCCTTVGRFLTVIAARQTNTALSYAKSYGLLLIGLTGITLAVRSTSAACTTLVTFTITGQVATTTTATT